MTNDPTNPGQDRLLSSETLPIPESLKQRLAQRGSGAPAPETEHIYNRRAAQSQNAAQPTTPAGRPLTVNRPSSAPPLSSPPPIQFADLPPSGTVRSGPGPEFASAELFRLDFPSGYHLYEWKSLATRTVRGRQQAKFTIAAEQASTRMTAETIGSCLSHPERVLELTIPDYYWLMYWLRINSYTQHKMVHHHECTDPTHRKKVTSRDLAPETLINVTQVDRTTLEETTLDWDSLLRTIDIINQDLEGTGWVVNVPRVRDLLEASDYLSPFADQVTDENGSTTIVYRDGHDWLANLASAVVPADGSYASFIDRVQFIEDNRPDLNNRLEAFLTLCSRYGVEEFISVKCRECGAASRTRVAIAAHSFL